MRTRLSVIFGTGLLLCLLAVCAAPATGWCGWGREATGRFYRGLRGLELTPEQEEQILTIRQEFERDSLELRQKLRRAKLELEELWAAKSPDEAAMNRKLAEITPLKIELRKMALEAERKIRSVLTREQLEKLDSHTRKGRSWKKQR